jgi:hypothetical protein
MATLKKGLYESKEGRVWVITVKGVKYLFVGNDTDCRLTMNDLANEEQRDRDGFRERQGMKKLKSEITGTMKELTALKLL